MNKQLIKNICEILQTIEEALDYLEVNEDVQVQADVVYSREQITTLLETEGKLPLRFWIDADSLSDRDWLSEVYRVMDNLIHPFEVKTVYDREFWNLLNYIWGNSIDGLVKEMKLKLEELKKSVPKAYDSFVEYFSRFPLWGSFSPEAGDYTTFELRAKVLKQRSFEFLWLYKRLEDYLSKRTLWAIMMNWAVLDTNYTRTVKSIFTDYYEPDIFPDNLGEVFVDVGAFDGDSIWQYTHVYGTRYNKIYAYEISASSCEKLRKNTKELHDIVICQKGAGSAAGFMKLVENQIATANRVKLLGNGQETQENHIEIVRLEEDIPEEHVDFIKMDIEGAEYDALLGCENLIRKQHPKLAICTYHGYEDIWRLPCIIDKMYPDYKFYLRHYGGNLIPTEFVLLCKAE